MGCHPPISERKLVPFQGEEDTGRCEGCDEELSGEESDEDEEHKEEEDVEEEDWNIAERVRMVAKNACWMQEVPLIEFCGFPTPLSNIGILNDSGTPETWGGDKLSSVSYFG